MSILVMPQVGYRFYTNNIDKAVPSFTFFTIKNNGGSTINLKRIASTGAGDVFSFFEVKSGESFSFPYITSVYDGVFVESNGNLYSILTDGTIP